ncbi:MAG: RdgB/HAM1 family non-canonical purine NTP pyrophosphatase [Lachnospiraceae bacterium]|nr:RdgB/HAM1 family non-canonical purine NTP pyrophosphatase [Lachnospiraceae bacterium]MBQ6196214.1 RdgB/HAM1 family non-canonical purine NTP pyrophosphatase [Lachnospiraceae bacterium]
MKTLIFATGNPNKAREVKEMLEGMDVKVLTMHEAGLDLDIEETGSTFKENSLIKARAVFAASRQAVLADDSGLEIDAFDGAPGVLSSRFMGEDTPYPEKCAAILERMEEVPEEERGADFRCVMSFIAPDAEGRPREFVEEGAVCGRIAHAPAGKNGFGYDPIFYLPERGVTTAELTDDEKNAISHRGLALRAIKPHIVRWITEE